MFRNFSLVGGLSMSLLFFFLRKGKGFEFLFSFGRHSSRTDLAALRHVHCFLVWFTAMWHRHCFQNGVNSRQTKCKSAIGVHIAPAGRKEKQPVTCVTVPE